MRTKHSRILNHKISIERKEHIRDAMGGESDDIWTEFHPAWASVTPIRGSEFFNADAHQNRVSHRIIIRYRSGIMPEMRVKHKQSRYFNIVSARDFGERERWLELMCEELI